MFGPVVIISAGTMAGLGLLFAGLLGFAHTKLEVEGDPKVEEIEEIEVRQLAEKFKESEDVKAIVFDGVITQKLADLSEEKNLKYLVGMRERLKKKPNNIKILTPEDFQ